MAYLHYYHSLYPPFHLHSRSLYVGLPFSYGLCGKAAQLRTADSSWWAVFGISHRVNLHLRSVRNGDAADANKPHPYITCSSMDIEAGESLEMTSRSHQRPHSELESDSQETEKLLKENEGDERKQKQLDKKSRASADTTVSWPDDSTEGSIDGTLETPATSILADQEREVQKCPSFLPRNFYQRKTPNGKTERVAPFAVVMLLVLLAVYVLNQADRLVLPVVIPNGLRCGVGKEDCASSNANNSSNSSSFAHSNSTTDCIQFNDDQQGLLTGVLPATIAQEKPNIFPLGAMFLKLFSGSGLHFHNSFIFNIN